MRKRGAPFSELPVLRFFCFGVHQRWRWNWGRADRDVAHNGRPIWNLFIQPGNRLFFFFPWVLLFFAYINFFSEGNVFTFGIHPLIFTFRRSSSFSIHFFSRSGRAFSSLPNCQIVGLSQLFRPMSSCGPCAHINSVLPCSLITPVQQWRRHP